MSSHETGFAGGVIHQSTLGIQEVNCGPNTYVARLRLTPDAEEVVLALLEAMTDQWRVQARLSSLTAAALYVGGISAATCLGRLGDSWPLLAATSLTAFVCLTAAWTQVVNWRRCRQLVRDLSTAD